MLFFLCGALSAHELTNSMNVAPPIESKIHLDKKLGNQIPLDLSFKDEVGNPVELASFFGSRPVVLALVYYECPSLCTMVLNGLFRSLQEVKLDRGEEFTVVAVSINPKETPELATRKKEKYLKTYLHSSHEKGIHFLTGEEANIKKLAAAIGFGYEYDPKLKIFAHPGMVTVLTPAGKVSSYLLGVDFPERDLRLALVDASDSKIGTAVDHFLLYCYKYDPLSGKYGLVVMNVLRLAGLVTLVFLGGLVGWLIRSTKKRDGYRIEAP